jgi:hypothetical protein
VKKKTASKSQERFGVYGLGFKVQGDLTGMCFLNVGSDIVGAPRYKNSDRQPIYHGPTSIVPSRYEFFDIMRRFLVLASGDRRGDKSVCSQNE